MKKFNKNIFLKFTCLAFATAALFLVASCTELLVSDKCNPQLSWQDFFGYISDGDYSAAFEMTGNSLADKLTSDSDTELNDMFMKKLSECCEYKFVSGTDVKGVTAWQTVEITFLDMRKLAKKAVNQAVEDAEAYAYKYGSYKTDEEISAAVRNSLIDLLPNAGEDCLTTVEICIKFCYKDKNWRPVIDDELYDVISGYSNYVDDVVAEYLKENSQ